LTDQARNASSLSDLGLISAGQSILPRNGS
jgi:hypothetical protein